MNPKDFDFFLKTAQVPHGMMATRKMKIALYITMAHDHLMLDPVQPKSYNAHSEQVSRAWFIKDGIRSVFVMFSAFTYHKTTRCFATFPQDGKLVHRRVIPSSKFSGSHFYILMKRGTIRAKCLAQEHNTVPRPELEPGPLDPEYSALTIRPPRLCLETQAFLVISMILKVYPGIQELVVHRC